MFYSSVCAITTPSSCNGAVVDARTRGQLWCLLAQVRLSFIDGVRLGGTCFVEITRVNKYIYNDVVVMDLVDCNICYCRVMGVFLMRTMATLSGQVINSMTTYAKAVVPPAGNTAAALKSQNSIL